MGSGVSDVLVQPNKLKGLMSDRETYRCVKNLSSLGDTLDGDSGADLDAKTRIRNEWMKFRECFPFMALLAPSLEMKG